MSKFLSSQLMESEVSKGKADREHKEATVAFKELEKRAADLERKLRRSIKKARYHSINCGC